MYFNSHLILTKDFICFGVLSWLKFKIVERERQYFWRGHAKLSWRGQIETAKVKLSHVLCRPITMFRSHMWNEHVSKNNLAVYHQEAVIYRNISTNCKMQCKVRPESQIFQKQSIEIVLSSVLMWAWTDAKFNNSVIYERKMCMSRTRTLLTLGPGQTSNFTCAESNTNESVLLFYLICIRFSTCEVWRLTQALVKYLRAFSIYFLILF